MRFYRIKEDYFQYLRKYDDKVSTDNHRVFIGIVHTNENGKFFIPLTSRNKKNSNRIGHIKVYDKDDFLCGINIWNAIPVSMDDLLPVDFSKESEKKQAWFIKEWVAIKDETMKEKIEQKFNKCYEKRCKGISFYKSMCCDYKKLEKCCDMYQIIKENEDIYNKLINDDIEIIKDNPTKLIDKANNEIIDLNNLDYDNEYEEEDYDM